jgi:hypothetical protein
MNLLFYLYLLIFPYTSNFSKGVFGLSLDEFLLILLFSFSILRFFLLYKKRTNYIFKVILFILVISLFCGYFSSWVFESDFSSSFTKLIKFPIIFFTSYLLQKTTTISYSMIIKLLYFNSLVVSLIGIFQFFNLMGVRNLLFLIYPIRMNFETVILGSNIGATSVWGDKNTFGGYLLFIIIIIIVSTFKRANNRIVFKNIRNNNIILVLLLDISALFLTGSSSSILCLLIFIYLYFFYKIKQNYKYVNYVFVLIVILTFYLIFSDVIDNQIFRQFSNDKTYSRVFGTEIETYYLPRSMVERFTLVPFVFGLYDQYPLSFICGFGYSDKAFDLLPWGTTEIGYLNMLYHSGIFFLVLYVFLFTQIYKKSKAKISIDIKYEILNYLCLMMVILNFVFVFYRSFSTATIFFILLGFTNLNKIEK